MVMIFLKGEKIMKIEMKLTINNIKQNKKRTAFTIISIILCTVSCIFINKLLPATKLLLFCINNHLQPDFIPYKYKNTQIYT